MKKESRKTVLVLGIARSGTSLLAGILHYLGVNMNPVDNSCDGYPYGSFEDEEIQNLTKIMSFPQNKKYDEDEMISKIESVMIERSEKNIIWGWKSALTYRCIDSFMKYIINPYFIVIFRSILDNARSIKEHFSINYKQEISFVDAIVKVTEEQHILSQTINKYESVPQYYVDYRSLENNIIGLSLDLSIFLGLKPDFNNFRKISTLYMNRAERYAGRKELQGLQA